MPGRNAQEAWNAFREPIERVVGAVDLKIRLKSTRYSDEANILTSGEPAICLERASGAPFDLYFSMTLACVDFEGEYRMSTRRYDYELRERNNVVFGWHWHPFSKQSTVKWPHLHIPSGMPFASRHVPTGRVTLEEILLFAIAELGVSTAHGDARKVLDDAVALHKKHRTWS